MKYTIADWLAMTYATIGSPAKHIKSIFDLLFQASKRHSDMITVVLLEAFFLNLKKHEILSYEQTQQLYAHFYYARESLKPCIEMKVTDTLYKPYTLQERYMLQEMKRRKIFIVQAREAGQTEEQIREYIRYREEVFPIREFSDFKDEEFYKECFA